MAKATRVDAPPQPKPPSKIVLELSDEEAQQLKAVLYAFSWGYEGHQLGAIHEALDFAGVDDEHLYFEVQGGEPVLKKE